MNPLTNMKYSAKGLSIAATLIAGLILTPAIALADNDSNKGHNRKGEYTSNKNHSKSDYKKSHRNEVKHNGHKRIIHDDKRGKLHRSIRKHYDRGYRYDHVHVINEYHPHDHGHSHYYYDYYDYDPRLSVGLHLGHFDLYFEE
jgi:hypothetical protein